MTRSDWVVVETTENAFTPTQLHHKETIFTLSNGYLGTRGTYEEGFPGSCPATLINGIYDAAPVVYTELANCPDWLMLTIRFGTAQADGSLAWYRFRLDQGKVLHYQRWLDLYTGVLSRQVCWESPAGYRVKLRFDRFVSLANQHVAGLRCQVESIDFDGIVEVQASLNGYPDNQGLLHWMAIDQGSHHQTLWLHLQSRHSKIDLGMAARLSVMDRQGQDCVAVDYQSVRLEGYVAQVAKFALKPGNTVNLEKVVTVFTSKDVPNPAAIALRELTTLPSYATLLAIHKTAWAAAWQTSDILIEGDSTAQLAVRYNLFQLLAAAPRHSDRVSIPAKALSGFAYKGHVFWDTEIFMVPFFTFTQPALARNLLTYRYHTLPGARRKAQAAGCEGAMYVWESADTGNEVTPRWVPHAHTDELVRIWCGDLELHISTDVAYAAWQYWQATGDDEWMIQCGAEMILDTAVFWGSRAEWNPTGVLPDGMVGRYELRDVIGPDEYHERVNNNAFTNRMVKWHLQTALKVWNWLLAAHPDKADSLKKSLNLAPLRFFHWQEVIQKLWVLQNPMTGLIEQFEGFFELQAIDLASYEPRLQSMQVILGIEGANQCQVLKQADVLMLLYLLRRGAFVDPDSMGELHPFAETWERQALQVNWDYYNPRTDHTYGSSLSPAVHAALACELGEVTSAYEHFMRSALVDLADVRSNAGEGIHAASAGGVWQALIFGFAGIQLTGDRPISVPKLPAHWTRLHFQLMWQGQTYEFDLRSQPTAPVAPHQPIAPHKAFDIQAVIFDLDGVITDTSEFHYLAWQRLADEENLSFDRELNENLRGVSRQDSLRQMLAGREVSAEHFQTMMARKNGYYLDLIRTITPEDLLPGVATLLKELREAGIKIALGSSSKNAPEVLQRLGIVNLMDAIADGNSVTQSKPAPDVFLYAAAQLGIAPRACVVIEDAAAGVEAALRAGMRSVGLGAVDRLNAANVVLPNLDAVHWDTLLAKLPPLDVVPVPELTVQNLTQLKAAQRGTF
jgi:beta-phosphoglucomutase